MTLWFLSAVVWAVHAPDAAHGQNVTNRGDALRAVCRRLAVGPGAVVADVGCGDGADSMVFAAVVGSNGTVLAQEIEPAKLKQVVEKADKRGLHNVVPVLGQSDDPRLPDGFVDLVYMNRVFHHFSRPQAMLERLWHDLKPGGYLVIVDQQKGPLADWAPMESREKQHHWTAETTVVRLAREAGFLFHDALEDLWHETAPFVLAFRRPLESAHASGDPDLPRPLDAAVVLRALPLIRLADAAVVFVGLDRGRAALPALREQLPSSARLFDVALEEWAVSREELPDPSPPAGVEVLRVEKGILTLPEDVRVGLVLFADAYHRLWKPAPLLQRLKEQMPPSGLVAVVERDGPETEPRRLAGHRRRLSSRLVMDDLRQAGFAWRRTLPAPTEDRYFLLFEPKPASADPQTEDRQSPAP
jgi:ubiquinone/menaquinone biosynthesis C-methylase UbiE